MSNVSRLCPHCGNQGSLEDRFCAHCGQSPTFKSALERPANLSVPLAKAAFPIVLGAVGFLAKVGWKLLQSKVARDVAYSAANTVIQSNLQKQTQTKLASQSSNAVIGKPPQSAQVIPKPKRTIRINSKWAVGDERGITRHGQSEHIIEIDE